MGGHLAQIACSLLFVGSCTSSSTGPDGGDGELGGDPDQWEAVEDAVTVDGDDESVAADREEQSGPMTFVVREGRFVEDRMCDFDGDGVRDNAIADLGEPLSGLFAMAMSTYAQGAIEEENRRLVAHAPFVEHLEIPNDPDISLIVFNASDTDRNPDNDFSGREPFFAKADSLDPCGEPIHYFGRAQIERGAFTAEGGTLPLPVGTDGWLGLVGRDVQTSGTIEPYGTTADVCACLYLAIHDIGAKRGFVEAGDLSFLEMLLAGGVIFGMPTVPGLVPNVDLDGDGHERFDLDQEGHIEACIDGDRTFIAGRDCWVEERMADAFSMTVCMVFVSALFGGRELGWQSMVEGHCDGGAPDSSLFDP